MKHKSIKAYFDVATHCYMDFDVPSLIDVSEITSEVRNDPETGNPMVVLYDGNDNAVAIRSVSDLKIETGLDLDYGLERIVEIEEH